MSSIDYKSVLKTIQEAILASQEKPVIITMDGKPFSVIQSYDDYISGRKSLSYHVAKLLSEHFPLRGKEASEALGKFFESVGSAARDDGLTEEDIMNMLNEKE